VAADYTTTYYADRLGMQIKICPQRTKSSKKKTRP